MFKQCTRCGKWVCGPVCFNAKAGLCEYCAPDLDEEIASAQAKAARQQVIQKAQEVDWVKSRDLGQVTGAICKSCGAKTGGAKFCPECGVSTAQKKHCTGCGAEMEGAPRFCPECGRRRRDDPALRYRFGTSKIGAAPPGHQCPGYVSKEKPPEGDSKKHREV